MSGAPRRSGSRTSTGRAAYAAWGRPRAPGSRGSRTGREARGPDRRPHPVADRESRARQSSYRSPSSCQYLLVLPILSLAPWHLSSTLRAHLGARWCAGRRFAVTLAQKGGLPEAHVPWVLRQWLLGAASRGGITNSTTARP